MDGARYNRDIKCIEEQKPAELYDPIPIIHFRPIKDYNVSPDDY